MTFNKKDVDSICEQLTCSYNSNILKDASPLINHIFSTIVNKYVNDGKGKEDGRIEFTYFQQRKGYQGTEQNAQGTEGSNR